MIHFTCDRCKRALRLSDDLRYVVKMEIYAAMDPVDADQVEDDRDHLLEVHEILERSHDEGDECISDDVYQKRCYDLCPDCHRMFVQNPLGHKTTPQFGFSHN